MMAAKEKKPPLFANPLRKRKRRKAAASENDGADRTPEGPCIPEVNAMNCLNETLLSIYAIRNENELFQDEECDNVSVNSLELSLQPDLKRSKRTMSRDDGIQFVHATFRCNLVIWSIKTLMNALTHCKGISFKMAERCIPFNQSDVSCFGARYTHGKSGTRSHAFLQRREVAAAVEWRWKVRNALSSLECGSFSSTQSSHLRLIPI